MNKTWIPNSMSLANLMCGFGALLAATNPQTGFYAAIVLIFAAGLLDAFDGKVAKFLKVDSTFGVEIDSLADLVSFGVAPAFLTYQMILKDAGPLGVAVALSFVAGGALRLARFNCMSKDNIPGSDTHFTGYPIPMAAVTLLAVLMFVWNNPSPANLPIVISATFLLALVMVSSIPYSKHRALVKNPLFVIPMIAGAFFLQERFIFPICCAFLLSGLVGLGHRHIKERALRLH